MKKTIKNAVELMGLIVLIKLIIVVFNYTETPTFES